VILVAE